MSTPVNDDENSDSVHRKYAAAWQRERPPMPSAAQLDVPSPSTAPTTDLRPSRSQFESELRHRVAVEPDGSRQMPSRRTASLALIRRLSMVVALAGLGILVAVVAQPFWRGLEQRFGAEPELSQDTKPTKLLAEKKVTNKGVAQIEKIENDQKLKE